MVTLSQPCTASAPCHIQMYTPRLLNIKSIGISTPDCKVLTLAKQVCPILTLSVSAIFTTINVSCDTGTLLQDPHQLRIQDFQLGGALSRWGGADLRRGCFSVKTYVKTKELDPIGGGARQRRPPPRIRQCTWTCPCFWNIPILWINIRHSHNLIHTPAERVIFLFYYFVT